MPQQKPNDPSSVTKKSVIYFIAVFFLGFVAGLITDKIHHSLDSKAHNYLINRLHFYPEGGHLIDPVIQDEFQQKYDPKLEAIRQDIKDYIKNAAKNGDVSDVSVYLRDFNKANWVGIDENNKFNSASLGKVPLMFTIFIKAQSDPAILRKEIQYNMPIQSSKAQIHAPQDRLQLGHAYTVEELVRNMIVYSDNISLLLLAYDHDLDLDLANQVLSQLQLPLPEKGNPAYQISAKDYASFFRMLYRATYLNKDLSERALRLLTESDFNEGIVAGMPRNVTVAHKFGESGELGKEVQLHDCGIVYYPDRPYLICIMTKGKDFGALQEVIKNISRIAYQHFSS